MRFNNKKAYIYIENSICIQCENCNLNKFITFGQLVFTTSMSGYQETITDSSYAGQIVVMSYPMIGNYGENSSFNQSGKIYAKGLIVNEIDENCDFAKFVKTNNTQLIKKADTRKIISIIKKLNCPRCVISSKKLSQRTLKYYFEKVNTNLTKQISVKTAINIDGNIQNNKKIAVIDFGVKNGIVENLKNYFEQIVICPYNTNLEYLLKNNFNCVLFSNGAGDPSKMDDVIDNIKEMLGKIDIYGICLGHQLLSIALGCKTQLMTCAHRGSNHPVINCETGKIIITSQNHGFVVMKEEIPNDVKITYQSVCDETIEGISSIKYNAKSVQFHPEGCAGTNDAKIIFDSWFN